jgi:chemotaxis protein methyltransferase CheR
MAASPEQLSAAGIRGDGVPQISDQEFALFQELIRREAGIYLAPIKKSMLVARLFRRLGALGLSSFHDYYRHVAFGPQDEKIRLLDAICTNETWFFRNRKQFELLRDQLADDWQKSTRLGVRSRTARVWSAGCATGEEPFSIAMVLADALPDWTIEILATDLSTRALDRAREATWLLEKSKDIPTPYLKQYMLRGSGTQDGKMRATQSLRTLVRFERLNLKDADWRLDPSLLPFDAIFCRNVFMYFDPEDRDRTIRRLLSLLTPTGHLFLGDAEGASGVDPRIVQVIPSVYRRRADNEPETRREP